MNVLAAFAAAFALTAAAEGALVLALTRSMRRVYASFLCNLLTNPALNLLLLGAVRFLGAGAYWPALAALELAVVAVEAYVWRLLTPLTWKSALFLSAGTNALSFALGLIVF